MLWRMFSVVSCFFFIGLLNFAQAQINKEVEPNDTCKTAQDFSKSSLPFTLAGYIDSDRNSWMDDFYKLTGTPGDLVEIYMKSDFPPYVLVDSSNCVDLDQVAGGYFWSFKVPGRMACLLLMRQIIF